MSYSLNAAPQLAPLASRLLSSLLLAALAAFSEELAPVPSSILVRSCDNRSPTLAYAAERVVAELCSVHGLHAVHDTNANDPFKAARNTGLIVLGSPDHSAPLASWCRDHRVDLSALATAADGYQIVARQNPWRVIITARSDVGAWYGACAWLDSLRDSAAGGPLAPIGEVSDAPALAIRHSRGLGGSDHLSRTEEAIESLDWWARWRMNVAHVGEMPEPDLKSFLFEAHKRGIRVVRGLGVRNLCAADDQAVAKCAEELRRFLQLGGDGASALWDDLPHDRCRGHCERCRQRFGTNSLPREIVRVLEALCDAAAEAPRPPLILWCPPHYSENRYPELSDEAFFGVIGESQKVRQQTSMYYCEFARGKTALLDRVGITNRVWWYNGLRTVYHVSHHWPSSPEMKLAIPGIKTFDAPDFARFEVGWKTGIGVRSDGTVLQAPEAAWQDLHTLPARFSGYYPCTAGHPYHVAMSGLFALDPADFDQAEADRVVFRAIFGPGCAKPARAWSDAYVQFQVWLAQCFGNTSTQARMTEAHRRLAQWRAYSREVQDRAAAGHSLLAPAMVNAALARMKDAEDSAEKILNQLNPETQPVQHSSREPGAVAAEGRR